MSTHWEFDCTGGHGSAASFVTQVNVYVDGSLVATRTHTPVEGDDAPWTFTVPLALDGTHTVKVTDFDAGHGETEFVVTTTTLTCAAPETTSTTAAPTTTTPVVATAAAATTTTAAPTTTAVMVIPSVEVPTLPPSTTATVLAETITAAPATLPATGSSTEPMVGAGLGFVAAGLLTVMVARRLRLR